MSAIAMWVQVGPHVPPEVQKEKNGFDEYLQAMAAQLGGKVVEGKRPKYAVNKYDQGVAAFCLKMTFGEYFVANNPLPDNIMPPSVAKKKGYLQGVSEDIISGEIDMLK